MAKQGINPLEQHVEKIVAGLAVLLFALVVFNYVISTPVMVTVANQRIAPGELDRKLGDLAQQVADMYKRASWDPPAVEDKPDTSGPMEEMQKVQTLMAQTPPPMVSPVSWAAEVPKPKGEAGLEGKHGLATVTAPTISDVATGVTYAGLVAQPAPLSDPTAAGIRATPATATVNQDVVWAFLRLHFDMQEQYEIFRQNGYSREQANLILFLEVQAQRQRVYPDGSTGPWEDFQPYRTVQVDYPQTVTIQNGAVGYADEPVIRTLFNSLVAGQTAILYPLPTISSPVSDPFPPYYANGVPPTPLAEAASPATPPTQQPVRPQPRRPVMRSGGAGGMRPGGAADVRPSSGADVRPGSSYGASRSPVRAAPSVDRGAIFAANQALMEAEKAYEEKRYLEAKQLLAQVRGVPAVQRRVTELQQKVDEDYAKWLESEEKLAAEKASHEARNAEIWVYDMQAPAGKTYRYRARVLLFNVYAHPDSDRLTELKDPQDGANVALVGAWSEPSNPIALAADRRFFFTSGSAERELASLDVFRFQEGRWFKDTQRNVGIGDAIGDVKTVNVAGSRIDVDYRTDFVVVDIGTDQAATVGSDKGSKVGIRRQQSVVLISMDAEGAIQPRWAAIDRVCPMYKELEAKVRLAADMPLQSTAATGLAR